MLNSTANNEKSNYLYGMQGIKFWETLSIKRF